MGWSTVVANENDHRIFLIHAFEQASHFGIERLGCGKVIGLRIAANVVGGTRQVLIADQVFRRQMKRCVRCIVREPQEPRFRLLLDPTHRQIREHRGRVPRDVRRDTIFDQWNRIIIPERTLKKSSVVRHAQRARMLDVIEWRDVPFPNHGTRVHTLFVERIKDCGLIRIEHITDRTHIRSEAITSG